MKKLYVIVCWADGRPDHVAPQIFTNLAKAKVMKNTLNRNFSRGAQRWSYTVETFDLYNSIK